MLQLLESYRSAHRFLHFRLVIQQEKDAHDKPTMLLQRCSLSSFSQGQLVKMAGLGIVRLGYDLCDVNPYVRAACPLSCGVCTATVPRDLLLYYPQPTQTIIILQDQIVPGKRAKDEPVA